MGNTENVAVTEGMEDTVRTKEMEMRLKEYKDLMADGHVKINYSDYVVFGDSNSENIIEESDVEVWSEAEVCPSFTVKALHNSGDIDKLTWNSSGNVLNMRKTGKIWDRVGISCCYDFDVDTAEVKTCCDEDTLRNTIVTGSKDFKAIMVKAVYSYIVPAYSTVDLKVSMNLHFFKRGGDTSAAYIGGVVSNIDTWTTATKSRISNWADNNGVIQTGNDKDCTKAQSNSEDVEFHLGINDYDCGEQENDTNEAKVCYATFYFMCAVEQANSIRHRLLMFDRADDKWNTKLTGTSTIYYDPNGGEMVEPEQTQQTFDFGPDQYTEVTLYMARRKGYELLGWYDRIADRCYAPGGIYTENRGVRLTAMWVPAQSAYTVNHFLQDTDGSYPETPEQTEQHTGPTGETVSVQVMEWEGFSSPENCQVNISGDDSQVVNYFYERKQYTITFLANGGEFTDGSDMETKNYAYGTQVKYPRVVSREGYTHKWSKTLSEMPAEDVTVRVIWTPKK